MAFVNKNEKYMAYHTLNAPLRNYDKLQKIDRKKNELRKMY